MPHSGRDAQTDSSRTGRPFERAEAMYEIDMTPATAASDKVDFPDSLNATRGASDIGKV